MVFLNITFHLKIRNWRQWLWQVFPKQSKNILALKKKRLVTFWSKNNWIGSDAIVAIKKSTKLLDARRGSKFRNFERESWKTAEVLSVRKFCNALKSEFWTLFLIEPDTDLYNLTDEHFKGFDFELDLSENKLGKIDLANFSNCRDFRNGSESLFSLDLSHNHIWSVIDSRKDNTQILKNVSLLFSLLTPTLAGSDIVYAVDMRGHTSFFFSTFFVVTKNRNGECGKVYPIRILSFLVRSNNDLQLWVFWKNGVIATVCWFMKIGLQKWYFWCQEIFYMNFDFKNGCKNEFKDNNEKSCSWFRNRVSHKIYFKAIWSRNGHSASLGVNFQ